MNNERAIELLHRLQDEQFDGIHGDERREALEMAVRALFSQQIFNDSQGLVNDCISRKMAIDAVAKWFYDVFGIKESDGTVTIFKRLRELPSAQPTFTEAEIQRMQELDSAQIQKAYDIGFEEGKKECKKGKWIAVKGRLGNEVECDNCHSVFWYWMGNYKFCPNCGARMDGEARE